MKALKTIFSKAHTRVNELGKDYEVFCKTENKDDEFDFYFKNLLEEPEKNDIENVFAIIRTESKSIPLYKHLVYYIVNENGKTFDNLTFTK